MRDPGTGDGLTRTQAEAQLRGLWARCGCAPGAGRVTVAEAGQRLLERLEAMGRKRTTMATYESHIRVHLVPFFGGQRVDRIGRREIEAFIRCMGRNGRSTKTTLNAAGVLHSIFELARREGWVLANPCTLVDKPQAPPTDADIRFLSPRRSRHCCAPCPTTTFGGVERPMYLTAAMTGMRQGELLALRWRDVDWPARRVRVRRSFVRGEFGPPKSKRSSRSVPLADRLAGELDLLHRRRCGAATTTSSSRIRIPASRSTARSCSSASRPRSCGRRARGALPRPAPHVRHPDGRPGVPMRTLQELLGHRDFKTTLIYADYSPSANEAEWVEAAFALPQVVEAEP